MIDPHPISRSATSWLTLSVTLAALLGANAARAADPPPYSLPWQLRPAAIADVFRLDSVVATHEDAAANEGRTIVSTMLYAHAATDRFAPMVRVGYVDADPPTGADGRAWVNPIVGGTYLLRPSEHVRCALFLGLAIPAGQGAGNTPNPATNAAARAGALARSAMDNAMFAVNDVTLFPGVDVAWVKDGWTLQGEATLLQLRRVRGKDLQPDRSKTNFTSGLHVGRFLGKKISIGAELRYQRWLSTPAAVEANEDLRDNLSIALGPRLHLKAGQKVRLRPGIAFVEGIHGPIDDLGYRILQLDLPISF